MGKGYTEFSLDDFICDEYFQNWVFHPDQESVIFWEEFVLQNPVKKEIIDEARSILIKLQFKNYPIADDVIYQSLKNTLSKLDEQQSGRLINGKLRKLSTAKYLVRAAAVVTGLVVLSSIIYLQYWNQKITISTAYNDVKNLVLPDGSKVILNAHSRVSFYKRQRADRPRQVWLEGEGYFEVRHINTDEHKVSPSQKFVVSTKDLNVHVLGTIFNVKERARGTEVILASGKILVDFANKSKASFIMKPGQMIVYHSDNNSSLLQTVDPAVHMAWIDKRLVLRDVSVNEIIEYIQEYYGYNVKLQDTAIGLKRLEGTLELDDIEDVLFVLSSTLHIKIERERDTLIISKRK